MFNVIKIYDNLLECKIPISDKILNEAILKKYFTQAKIKNWVGPHFEVTEDSSDTSLYPGTTSYSFGNINIRISLVHPQYVKKYKSSYLFGLIKVGLYYENKELDKIISAIKKENLHYKLLFSQGKDKKMEILISKTLPIKINTDCEFEFLQKDEYFKLKNAVVENLTAQSKDKILNRILNKEK